MKNALYISIVALVISVVALAKGFMPASHSASSVEASIGDILNANPEFIISAMQNYEVKMREQSQAQAREMIKQNIDELNNNPNSPFAGPANAKFVLVEFFDYACGYCQQLFPSLNQVLAQNSDVKVVYKPLAFVSQASEYAARAALAANEQGKFKEMHTALFTVQGPLTEAKINELAGKIGLNVDKLKKDIQSDKVTQILVANNELAGRVQIGGVPTLILNGDMLQTLDAGIIQDAINRLR